MVSLDPFVRILGGVMKRAWRELMDRSCQRRCLIGHDLGRVAMRADRRREEPTGGSNVPSRRDVHVDDLTVPVELPIDVPPPARHLHVRLIHEPTAANHMSTRPRRVDQQRSEPLHPPEHGDVIDLNPTLDQELFDVAVGQPIPQVAPDGEHDDLWGTEIRRTPKAPADSDVERGDVSSSRHSRARAMQQCR